MRESIEVGLEAVVDSQHESHIEHGGVLTAFAEAIVAGDVGQITVARQAVVEAAGELAMVDAAGVVANFQRNVRIADGTGIPLVDAAGVVANFQRNVRIADGTGIPLGFSHETREQLARASKASPTRPGNNSASTGGVRTEQPPPMTRVRQRGDGPPADANVIGQAFSALPSVNQEARGQPAEGRYLPALWLRIELVELHDFAPRPRHRVEEV